MPGRDTVKAATMVIQKEPESMPGDPRWDGLNRKKQGHVNLYDFAEVGQLALQIDSESGKGNYGPASPTTGGFINTSLVKMINLLIGSSGGGRLL